MVTGFVCGWAERKMSLELRVADKEKDAEIWRDRLSGDAGIKFVHLGYELSIGKKFEDYWNNFWKAPGASHYLIDYSRNIYHNPNSLLSNINTAVELHQTLGKKYEARVPKWINALEGLVHENTEIFDKGMVDISEKSGPFPNKQLYEAFMGLKLQLQSLKSLTYGTPEFGQKFSEVLFFYEQIVASFKNFGTD